jgi:hypothetical protein
MNRARAHGRAKAQPVAEQKADPLSKTGWWKERLLAIRQGVIHPRASDTRFPEM